MALTKNKAQVQEQLDGVENKIQERIRGIENKIQDLVNIIESLCDSRKTLIFASLVRDELEHAQEKRKADEAFDYEYGYVYGIVTTELELLRQHIGELEAKNAKLESEKAEIEPSF
ncbi:hypothetical protein GLOIN_2v1477229 [Rhizophagus irregularis DAOM 181602=DAOM 197198]|uniref:Uncharacterized protein n=1 Tax=Rhizophagus irregularis (strain DAOM 181602 / DAOM 197198 / MUCL 43194) TaxID=747089 RepID=A0A2P4Q5X8_RHIID|nr:hypothetical protein GLOIN_2v1477229 [Rhizophagus irregularis DAOM 181602=DAOM 197198]POG73049.1 hypothetical protein GLOIN_2v1477229 [Rhizophagus irregularis DAOM 181602=DAOM 197198]|eukprot:XP_025179915.1 hypothetical protein GLOIN_2v1477229 [Rhizophagus irregularis DAOM 181602=DAOM 197198]